MTLALFHSPEEWAARYAASGRGSVLTIGNFDGMHLGHQAILRSVIERARSLGAISGALTFDPPPLKVLRPNSAPPRISTSEQRIEWFRSLGLEAALILRFDQAMAQTPAEDFVQSILVAQLRLRAILVGEDFSFGREHAGDASLLLRLGAQLGFDVGTVPPVRSRGEVVSSTAIRRAVAEGDVGRAARLLGHPFALTGEIHTGTGTGNKLVFPTLNLLPEQELLPGLGVYVTESAVAGKVWPSVTNVGRRPTFNGSSLSIESHLLGFSGEFTRGRMEVRFLRHLRGEKKFPGPAELRAQITRDIARAQRFFARLRKVKPKSTRT